MAFQIGDRCRVRQWEDMEAEYGLTPSGNINCAAVFTEDMRPLCGLPFTVSTFCGDRYTSEERTEEVGLSGGSFRTRWAISADMLEPYQESPIQTPDVPVSW